MLFLELKHLGYIIEIHVNVIVLRNIIYSIGGWDTE